MTKELKKGYYIDSFYDRHTKSYITTLRDNESNQIGDASYSGNMTDRDADVQAIKEKFFQEYLPAIKNGEDITQYIQTDEEDFPEPVMVHDDDEDFDWDSYSEDSLDEDEFSFEESLKSKVEETKRKTKKAKLPALSTLSPIMPDGAAGIDTFNSGVGLSEEWLDRDELVYRLKRMGYRNYNFDRHSDASLYNIYKKNKASLEKKARERAERSRNKQAYDRNREKLSSVKYDADSDTYSDGSYYKDGIEFESEDAARDYFEESMRRDDWNVYTIEDILKNAWKDAGFRLRDDDIDISRHDNWCIVEIRFIDPWLYKQINKSAIKKALKKELGLSKVEQSSYTDYGWGNSNYGKTLRYDLYRYSSEEQGMNESIETKVYLNDMHEAWDIDDSVDVEKTVLTESINTEKKHNFRTLTEGLKYFDRKAFEENCEMPELELLYEGIKNNLDANDIKKLGNFIQKASNADEITTYLKGLLSEDVQRYSDVVPYEQRKYWYFTTHGIGPGTIPKDLNVLEVREGESRRGMQGDFVCLDGVLNTSELQKYDMKEEAPGDLNESLTESYIEEWWGQTDEDPHDLIQYGLKVTEVKKNGDETLYRFEGRKTDIERAMNDGYFASFDYEEDAGHSKDLEKSYEGLVEELLKRLHTVGFELDDSVTNPIKKNAIGGRHIQVINPNLIFPLEEAEGDEEYATDLMLDDLKEVTEVLDTFEDEYDSIITFNFGPNNDEIITGGIDIR